MNTASIYYKFQAEPQWRITEEFLPSETQRAMEIDSLASSRPISFEVRNSRQIRETFDVISYAKGKLLLLLKNSFILSLITLYSWFPLPLVTVRLSSLNTKLK